MIGVLTVLCLSLWLFLYLFVSYDCLQTLTLPINSVSIQGTVFIFHMHILWVKRFPIIGTVPPCDCSRDPGCWCEKEYLTLQPKVLKWLRYKYLTMKNKLKRTVKIKWVIVTWDGCKPNVKNLYFKYYFMKHQKEIDCQKLLFSV